MYPKIVEHEFSSCLMIFQSLATPLTLTYFILRQLKWFSTLKNHEIYMPTLVKMKSLFMHFQKPKSQKSGTEQSRTINYIN